MARREASLWLRAVGGDEWPRRAKASAGRRSSRWRDGWVGAADKFGLGNAIRGSGSSLDLSLGLGFKIMGGFWSFGASWGQGGCCPRDEGGSHLEQCFL